ncbi:hypothetical protein [Alsobacter soli]|uniref:hypothetical protein n=1 Tax=Alsobacter soli TaxID=2109933 RepID=UPI0011B289E4|nr:hypothetical protein [Alsobacter soli]
MNKNPIPRRKNRIERTPAFFERATGCAVIVVKAGKNVGAGLDTTRIGGRKRPFAGRVAVMPRHGIDIARAETEMDARERSMGAGVDGRTR